MTIPTHVVWRKVGERTRVAEFTRGDTRLGASRGTCWEGEIETCAKAIVRAAGRL